MQMTSEFILSTEGRISTSYIKKLLLYLKTFGRWSGLKVNNGKTQVIIFGIKGSDPPPL